jgi:hypothetical protein
MKENESELFMYKVRNYVVFNITKSVLGTSNL